MTAQHASRTLVKSVPELWAECSDPASLARHLDTFGEIRITNLTPETAVAWEGEAARGTVRLEPSGWGTRVVLTADRDHENADPDRADPQPRPEPSVVPAPRRGALSRAFHRWRRRREPDPSPAAAEPEPEREPSSADETVAGALDAALDSLGRAHHRPYSRA